MNDLQAPLPSADLSLAYKEIGQDSFQPHLILLHPGSPPCKSQGKDSDGKPQPPKGIQGNYFANDVDFGPQIDVLLIDSRWHAFLKENNVKTKESYNLFSETYKEIKNTLQVEGTRPRFGVSHLLFLIKQSLFVIFHPNTKTSRQAGYKILMFGTPIVSRENELEKAQPFTRITRLSAEYIEKVANPFYKPQVEPLEIGFFKEQDIREPEREEIDREIKLFRAPIDKEPKEAEASVER